MIYFNESNIQKLGSSLAGVISVVFLAFPALALGQDDQVRFHEDIEPILQRSCQSCHRTGGVGPMPLVTYDEVAPFAGLIEYKTSLRDKAGAMPPWYMEKRIGIQDYKNDMSLSDEEISKLSIWARTGTARGNPGNAPEPLSFVEGTTWTLGQPDLIVETQPVTKLAGTPDWWGELESVPVKGMEQDRYIKSVEIIEVNDIDYTARSETAVGGRYIFHHLAWSTTVSQDIDPSNLSFLLDREGTTFWPVHEVGRNPDIFDEDSGRLLKKDSTFVGNSVHLHSNGRDTTATLQIGFRFHPVGYEPKYKASRISLGNGVDISIGGNEKDQELHAYHVLQDHTKIITFEPHLHAPGVRMCLEAIWGYSRETLSCSGYDHNWVRGYTYGENSAPILPKGTVLHITGYMDNSDSNPNIPDTRNWQGSGNRSVTNMFIDLGMRVTLTNQQFYEAMEERRNALNANPNTHIIGCPLCMAPIVSAQ